MSSEQLETLIQKMTVIADVLGRQTGSEVLAIAPVEVTKDDTKDPEPVVLKDPEPVVLKEPVTAKESIATPKTVEPSVLKKSVKTSRSCCPMSMSLDSYNDDIYYSDDDFINALLFIIFVMFIIIISLILKIVKLRFEKLLDC